MSIKGRIIFDYNRTLFDPETNNFYAGATEVVKTLSQNYELVLISRNEPGRKEEVIAANIEPSFVSIFFVPEKTLEIFREIGEGAEKVIVIGDYLQEEILFGNQLGFTTIWIKQGKFSNATPSSKMDTPSHTIKNLSELLELLLEI